MTLPVAWFLLFAAVLFSLGAFGLRRTIHRSVEVILHASALALVACSRLLDDLTGQRLALLAILIGVSLLAAFRRDPRADAGEPGPEGNAQNRAKGES